MFFIPFSKSVSEISFAVAFVLWLLRKFPWDEPFGRVRAANAAYAAFLAAAVLSLATSPRELLPVALRGVLKWLEYVLLFFLCAETFREKRRARRLLAVFLVSSTLLVLDGFWQMTTGTDLVKGYSVDIPGRFVRMRGSLPSPNDLGAVLGLSVPLWFCLWLRIGRWNLRSGAAATVLGLHAIAFLMTLSRSVVVGLVAASVLFVLFRGRKRDAFCVLAVPVLVVLGSGLLRENFITSLGPGDITIGERFRYWGAAWRMILEHPILGNGVNLFYLKFPDFAAAGETYRGYAHNSYLQIWAETGIVGLLAFLVPVAGTLHRRLLARPKGVFETSDALFVGLLAFLFQSFFDTNLHALQTSLLFWTLWGALHGDTVTLRRAPAARREFGDTILNSHSPN